MHDLNIFNRMLTAQKQILARKNTKCELNTVSEMIPEIVAMGVYNLRTKESFKIEIDNITKKITLEDGSFLKQRDGSNLKYFYIIHNFGFALSYYFNTLNQRRINLQSIYMMGLKILDIIEVVHRAGYVHNDISLDKILLAQGQTLQINDPEKDNFFDEKCLHIDNIAYMTPYIDFKSKKHLKQEKVQRGINIKNEF